MKKTIIFLLGIALIYSCSTSPDSKENIPVTPSNLIGTIVSPTQINLTWTDNSTNETGFKIERRTLTGTYAVIGTVNTNVLTFTDSGLTPSTPYIYRVYSYNSGGNSPSYSNEFGLIIETPNLLTTVVSSITPTTASSGGRIIDNGSGTITAKGVVWSTSQNPTIALSTKTNNGTGTVFTSAITGLTMNTTYYVRAYATNVAGTSYGNEVSFTTTAIPTLTTTTASSITFSTASSGGIISSDGGGVITARGVVWSTSQNPTIALITKTNNGTGTGTFTSAITGLTANTTYYVRAYVTNVAGTSYGNEVSFITLSDVVIGTQKWTIRNLNVETYSDGTPIPQVTDLTQWEGLTTGAWCYYNNDSANGSIYGKLYNWYAVAGIWNEASKTNVSQRKKLAPTGYHVPSDQEWIVLTNYLGGESIAGGKMKEIGTSHWTTPNTNATNSSSFTGLPGGSRSNDGGSFHSIGVSGDWWSSSDYYTSAWYRYLYYYGGLASRSNRDKTCGLSVRCLRD